MSATEHEARPAAWLGDLGGARPCDAADFGAAATFTPDGSCRCLVCSRCGHHTGNAHQGHYWALCKALRDRVKASLGPGETLSAAELASRSEREFHFCCPDPVFGCELEAGDDDDG